MSLTVVGENRQEKNRVGMEVQSLQVVMAENRKEELRKGRHQTGGDGANEERVEGASFVLGKGGTNIEHWTSPSSPDEDPLKMSSTEKG